MKIKGIVFTVISATLFDCMPAIVQQAYSYGATPETVTFFRNFFAVPVVLFIMLLKKISFHGERKQLFSIALISLFGITTGTLTLISSYAYIGTSMATTLHFVYPVFVALICFIFFKEKLSKQKTIALMAAIVGIFFFFQKGEQSSTALLGILLSVISGVAYAFYMVGLDKFHLRTLHPMTLTFYISLFSACGVLVFGTLKQSIVFALPMEAYFFMLCNSIFISFCAVALLQIGVRYLNATTAAMFSLFEPITSNVIGVVFMGESISLAKIIGSVIILASAGAMAFLENASAKKESQDTPLT